MAPHTTPATILAVSQAPGGAGWARFKVSRPCSRSIARLGQVANSAAIVTAITEKPANTKRPASGSWATWSPATAKANNR
jgi:hypothetical protein